MKRITTNLNEEDDGVTKALNLVFVDISNHEHKDFRVWDYLLIRHDESVIRRIHFWGKIHTAAVFLMQRQEMTSTSDITDTSPAIPILPFLHTKYEKNKSKNCRHFLHKSVNRVSVFSVCSLLLVWSSFRQEKIAEFFISSDWCYFSHYFAVQMGYKNLCYWLFIFHAWILTSPGIASRD